MKRKFKIGYAGIMLIIMVIQWISIAENEEKKEKTIQEHYGTLNGLIIDGDTGEKIPARVYATGSDGTTYMAEDCIPYINTNYGLNYRFFSTKGNAFSVKLPCGKAHIRIERGKEYIPVREDIDIQEDVVQEKTFTMKRWINMAEKGWYSSDMHVHRPLKEIEYLLLAEDLNFTDVSSLWNDKKDEDLDEYLLRADAEGSITIDERHIYGVLCEEVERYGGTIMLKHIGKNIIPIEGSTARKPTDLSLIEMARKQGGYIDNEKPFWREAFINVALGEIDFLEISNNHFWDIPSKLDFDAWGWHRKEMKSDYPKGLKGYAEHTFDVYYAYLNCGFRIMPTAGSAVGVMPSPIGYNRVYAKVEGNLTYNKWFDALKNGPSFVTNGPMIFLTVNREQTGKTVKMNGKNEKAAVECVVYSYHPIEKLDILHDGNCEALMENVQLNKYEAVFKTEIKVRESGWIAARCFEKTKDNVKFAHTAPIFIEVDGQPLKPKRYAVEYFIERAKELISEAENGIQDSLYINHPRKNVLANAKIENEDNKNEVMQIYIKALHFYEDLLKKVKD